MRWVDRSGNTVEGSLWDEEDGPLDPLLWCHTQAMKRGDCTMMYPLNENKTMIRHRAQLIRGLSNIKLFEGRG